MSTDLRTPGRVYDFVYFPKFRAFGLSSRDMFFMFGVSFTLLFDTRNE